MRFIESKVQQKQMYKLCLYSAWGMGCGRWRQQQSPELLLDHVPVGGRASSMHCAEQAAIAQPAIGLCSIRAWGQGKGRYVQQRLNRCPLVHREVGCFFYTILGWAVPGRDRTTMNMGQEPAPQEKWNHPLLITTVDLALQVDVPLVYISPEQWTDLCPQQREGSASSGGPTASEAKCLAMRNLLPQDESEVLEHLSCHSVLQHLCQTLWSCIHITCFSESRVVALLSFIQSCFRIKSTISAATHLSVSIMSLPKQLLSGYSSLCYRTGDVGTGEAQPWHGATV